MDWDKIRQMSNEEAWEYFDLLIDTDPIMLRNYASEMFGRLKDCEDEAQA